jgi:hypothetical protein
VIFAQFGCHAGKLTETDGRQKEFSDKLK